MIRPQFTLRALLVAMLVVGSIWGWVACKRDSRRREIMAAAAIVRRTGSVWYRKDPAGSTWIARLLGYDRPEMAVEVSFDYDTATDADLAAVAFLPSLERLTVYCDPAKPLTPSGLVRLKGLPLRTLNIIGHPIGDEGLMQVQELATLERLE